MENKTVLQEAQDIVYKGGEQNAERSYGKATETFVKIANIASVLCGKEISPADVAKIQIAHKLVRESVQHKRDNLVDLCGYTSILQDIEQEISEDKSQLKINFSDEKPID